MTIRIHPTWEQVQLTVEAEEPSDGVRVRLPRWAAEWLAVAHGAMQESTIPNAHVQAFEFAFRLGVLAERYGWECEYEREVVR
jgi:hypothetical protein